MAAVRGIRMPALLKHAKRILPPAPATQLRGLRDRGRVRAALDQARAEAGQAGELLFHGGAHEAWCYLADFATMRPHLAPGAVVVYDDTRWGETDTLGAWREITSHPTVKGSLDCGAVGVFAAAA